MTDDEAIAAGQFWLHKDGRRMEVVGVFDPDPESFRPEGLVILRVWGREHGRHHLSKMRPDRLSKVAKRWYPDAP